MKNVIFDIDETLAHTRPMVVEAYRRVGVLVPSNAWGMPWRSWLPSLVARDAEAVHAAKNDTYVEMLRTETPGLLPCRDVAWELGQTPDVRVSLVTGASRRAADAVLNAIAIPTHWLLATEMTPHQKARMMTIIANGAVLVDDDDQVRATARRLRERVGDYAIVAPSAPNVREVLLQCIR